MEAGRRIRVEDRLPGLVVLLLDEDEHLELVGGVVQAPEVAEQLAHDVGLAEHRHEHGVDGQVLVAQRGHLLGIDALDEVVARAAQADEELERRGEQERHRHGADPPHDGRQRPQEQQHDERDERDREADLLRRAHGRLGGVEGIGSAQRVGRVIGDLRAERPQHRLPEAPALHGGEGDGRSAQLGLDLRAQRVGRAQERGDEDRAVLVAAQRQPAAAQIPAPRPAARQLGVDALGAQVLAGGRAPRFAARPGDLRLGDEAVVEQERRGPRVLLERAPLGLRQLRGGDATGGDEPRQVLGLGDLEVPGGDPPVAAAHPARHGAIVSAAPRGATGVRASRAPAPCAPPRPGRTRPSSRSPR